MMKVFVGQPNMFKYFEEAWLKRNICLPKIDLTGKHTYHPHDNYCMFNKLIHIPTNQSQE